MKQVPLKIFLLLALALLLTAPVFADTGFNAVNDFLAHNNPSGAWTYGWLDGSGSHLFTKELQDTMFNYAAPGVDAWTDPAFADSSDYFTPVVAKNLGTSAIVVNTAYLPTDMLLLHPGTLGQMAVVGWTAPTSNYYDIDALFTGLDTVGTTTDVHAITQDGTDLFTGYVYGYEATTEYKTQGYYLNAGDTIEFAVGGNGTFGFDLTGLQDVITVSAIPEPMSGLLFGTLLLGTGFLMRLRRR